ncbi:MAG: hypothetical protein R3E83_09955 [Burkholderiaceae bacterium]
MSLLIKALKQAERSHRSGEGLEADDPTAAPVAAPAERAAPVANTATPKDARASREADAADVRPAPGQRSTPGDQPGGRDLPEAKADWSMLLEIPDPAPPREAAPEVAKPPRPVSAAPTPAIAMMEMDAIDTPAAPSPTAPGDDGMAFDDAKSELSFAPLEHALEPAPMEFDAAQVVANQDDAPERAEPTQEMHDASSIGFEPAVAAEPVIAAVQATRPADKPRAPEQSAGRVSAVAAEIDAGVRSTHSAPQAQLEQAQPAAKKSGKRNSYALLGLLLLIGLSIGGWFGYQTMSVPDLSQFEANTPDPMLANQSNAAATGSGNTPATGSGNAAGLEPATNASAGPDPMLAEGGEVASSIDDGRVLTLAFAPAASPADSLSTKTVVANPKPAGIDGAQSAATRPSAATRKAASGSETEARSTAGSAAVQPADRQPANPAGSVRPPAAAARPAPPSDAAAPADSASEAGTPTVRLRRALSPAERIAMVKAGAYRSFRQNRLAEAEKLYRDVLVRPARYRRMDRPGRNRRPQR